ncbi:hypothetical protein [Actomonas aquatica]|uniref:Uncharacterized protein n=1 Tax=Actomonas aquatica TaxID=2866162 RepID=A0ABZ1C869_9BACT|nr:hypothetical protein [Opitutus sp. WL0086]WRQ87661.1 hypothetical protein K1X11_022840 [Opitutus sp. WL0086]
MPHTRLSRLWWMLVSAPMLFGAEPTATKVIDSRPAPAPRSHVLFLGADLKVKDGETWYDIDGVEKGWFVSASTGELPVRIPMNRPGFEFSFDRNLKLTAKQVSVSNLKMEPTFTPARDPSRRWLESQSLAISSAGDLVNAASRELRSTIVAAEQREAMLNSPNTPAEVKMAILQQPAPDVDGAMGDFQDANFGSQSEQYDPGFYARRQSEARSKRKDSDGHDALELEAEVRVNVPMEHPYAVVFVEFSLPDDLMRYRRVFAEPLPPLKPGKATKVSWVKGGFPVGYELGPVQLHFFDGAEEIATDDAERRTPVTAEEGFQFAVLDHVSRARDAKVDEPAALIEELVTSDLRSQWASQGRACVVRVGSDGLPEAAYAAADVTTAIDDVALQALVANLRFRPAVENGEAIAGQVKLGERL